ncbi:CCA tRNA nucleotidyltransferase [Citreimonas salinaria]|uniref:Poly(A) polymerase n=1 Tax=Citreimonas salinaria TaxID=321339 RepID=A0A1H3FBR2_9RHOB|nr:CCA tRNA nucleotidyltransferase [Citreimonas salinaria]SDX88325.1 poly(A) polymerase [Citreimonas salinaria]
MTRVSGDWLDAPATQAVMAMLDGAGHAAYAVGGCVRNALLGAPVADVDISTDAHPERVIALARAAGLKPVPTGVEHGTVTVVAEGLGFEVTTFRADVETDGRHAVVRFSDTVEEDAARRDFTMNALYADRHGRLIDPLGGLADLQARRVRFIGQPSDRIAEDYLRILRFFRFAAWYGDPDQGFDADALDGIARNLDGLEKLSRERVGAELRKLMAAPDPGPAVAVMVQVGVLRAVLPGADPGALGPLIALEPALNLPPDALRRLAALGCDGSEDLRHSKADARRLALLHDATGAPAGLAELAWRHGADTARDVAVLRAAMLDQPLPTDATERIDRGASARFPVTARDLMPTYEGPALGQRLRELEARWIASDFTLTRNDLLR